MSLRDRIATRDSAVAATAVGVALPVVFAFQVVFATSAWATSEGEFLLLLTLGVGVPTVYRDYWPAHGQLWQAVGWTVLACAVVAVEFTGLYVLLTVAAELPPFVAAVGAFLATWGLNLGWLVVRRR